MRDNVLLFAIAFVLGMFMAIILYCLWRAV